MLKIICILLLSHPASAVDVTGLQDAWAGLKYRDSGAPDRLQRAQILEGDAAALVAQSPGSAEPLFWQAQVLALTADILHSMKSLDKMSRARALLEQAEKIDPNNADVQAELGTYFYHVPGWPVSFGNKAVALQHLQRAIAIAPDGRDPNYLMADYLIGQGRRAEAIPYLTKAASAPQPGENPAVAAGRAEEAGHDLAAAAH